MPLRLEVWAITRIRPYERNPREHSPAEIRELAAHLVAHGWTNPLQVDAGGNLVAGHKRLAAAQVLGLKQVPVIVLSRVDAARRRRLVLADNKLGLKGRWNEPLLLEELNAAVADGTEIRWTGFDDEELRVLADRLQPPPLPDPPTDRTPRTGRFTFTLIFDSEQQLAEWHNFLTWLRDQDYGREASTGLRVTRFVTDAMRRKS